MRKTRFVKTEKRGWTLKEALELRAKDPAANIHLGKSKPEQSPEAPEPAEPDGL